jgi:aspartyl protease family protein
MKPRMIVAGLLAALSISHAPVVSATDVRLVGLAENRAILVIDGGRPRLMQVGQTAPGGITLVAVSGELAVVEVNGKQRKLRFGEQAYQAPTRSERPSLTLVSDVRGHFVTTGTINGATVRLMVDTGASLVAMGPADASRAGIDFKSGLKARVNTANGIAIGYRVRLDSLRIGDIVLYNIDALVHENMDLPMVLLGMSFLGRLDMRHEGDTLTLTKRY